jgi:hypothetical protein
MRTTKTKQGTKEQWEKLGMASKKLRNDLFEINKLAFEIMNKTTSCFKPLRDAEKRFDDFRSLAEETMFNQLLNEADTKTFYSPMTEEQKKMLEEG